MVLFFFFLLPELISATGGRNNPAFTVELTQCKLVIAYFVHSVGIYLLIAVTCLFKYIQEITRLHIICSVYLGVNAKLCMDARLWKTAKLLSHTVAKLRFYCH